MSTHEHKQLAIRALRNLRGDDLERARAAFAHMSAAQLAQPYGHSGKTAAQILAEYETERVRIDAAIAWVEAVQ